jgi:hypothetical protein
MRTERRYEVSDGVTGAWTITGYFPTPIEAVAAFVRCHEVAFDNILVYELLPDDQDSCVYSATVNGSEISLHPVKKG